MASECCEKLDLLLKGGRVIDPANHVDAVRDVGIRKGKIARMEETIPAGASAHVVDVSGLLVTPGLIDIHVHAYITRQPRRPGLFMDSLNADAHFLGSGVTTCVDTGSAGSEEVGHFRETVIERSITRILAYVNISAPGMGDPEQNIGTFDVDAAAGAGTAHADVVVGIKTAHYWPREPFDAEHPPWESVERAVQAGERCGMPVMVDFWPRPPERPYPDLILKMLRPGDIHTHVFARQFPVIDEKGKVYPYMYEARERGVWFDLGHGSASFWFRNGARAIAEGVRARFDQHGPAHGQHPGAGVQHVEYDVQVPGDGHALRGGDLSVHGDARPGDSTSGAGDVERGGRSGCGRAGASEGRIFLPGLRAHPDGRRGPAGL